jgi:short subunit dehydrogenase
MIDVNVGPALWLTQAVVPYLRERGSGAIVHVAARPGLEPTAGMAASAVSKAALVHLTRVLDLELRPLGIQVNAVAPQISRHRQEPSVPHAGPACASGRAGGGRRHHRLPRKRRRRAGQRRGRARLRRLSLSPPVIRLERTTMSSNSAPNRRSFLARGAAFAAVPAVASLAVEGLTGRASADTLPDYAPIPPSALGPCRQRAGLLRGAGGEEPVLGHRQCLSGGVPDYPRRGRAVGRAPVDRAQPVARHHSSAIQGDGQGWPEPAQARLSADDRFCGAPVTRITRIR